MECPEFMGLKAPAPSVVEANPTRGICAMSRLETSSLYQLTATRLKLTLREPEAIFWIFIFPILLAIGLGIAFRNRPADVLPVGATTDPLTQALAADKGLKATEMNESAGTHALAVGTIVLLAEQSGDGVVYRYDNTNPDARTARMIAGDAIEKAAGRKDVLTAAERAGARDGGALHRLCRAGAAGNESDGIGNVGIGILDCGWPAEKVTEADGGVADAEVAIPDGIPAVAARDAGG